MLHAKYQGSRPCGFRQEDFLRFPYISLCKTFDPKARALLFQTRRFFHFFPKKDYVKFVTPWQGHFLALGV